MTEVPISLYELPDRASDGISDLAFSNEDFLLAASWDGSVRLYNVDEKTMVHAWTMDNAVPVLSCAWVGRNDVGVSGSVDGSVCLLRRGDSSLTRLGSHGAGVRRVSTSQRESTIYSGSWDRSVGVWDPRSHRRVDSITSLDGKVFAMCLSESSTRPSLLLVGTSTMQIFVYDPRALGRGPILTRASPLKHQTRCIAPFPDGKGYALSSIEGRIAIEYFDTYQNGSTTENVSYDNYAFKCHRDNQGTIFPVNALAFHPLGSLASGGTDKRVNIWDPLAKRRLCQLIDPFPSSISALAFNSSGSRLAIASSYNFEHGEELHSSHNTEPPLDQIFIHTPLAYQVTPKSQPLPTDISSQNLPPSSSSTAAT